MTKLEEFTELQKWYMALREKAYEWKIDEDEPPDTWEDSVVWEILYVGWESAVFPEQFHEMFEYICERSQELQNS